MLHFRHGCMQLASVFTIALSVAGCSGGGGGGNNSLQDESNLDNAITLSGTVAKGIVKDGVVSANELDINGATVAIVGAARTIENGSYTLALSDAYNGGPIKISITKDDLTQMKCDVPAGCGTRKDDLDDSNGHVEFGEWYKPTSLVMTALLPVAHDNETISVNVTPYTHMAAEHALAQGNLSAVSIETANSEVSALIGGVDILRTAPFDITNPTAVGAASETEIAYAALASSIATLAPVGADGEPDIAAALAQLVSSFATGSLAADDNGAANDSEIFSLQEILDASQGMFSTIGRVDTSGVLAKLETEIADAPDSDGDGVDDVNPAPSPNVGDENLAKVKALVSDIRTWGGLVLNEDEVAAQAFIDQVETVVDSDPLQGEEVFWDLIGQALASYVFGGGSNDLTSYQLTLNWHGYTSSYFFTSGTISSPSPGVIELKGASFGGEPFDTTFRAPEDGSESDVLTFVLETAAVDNSAIDKGEIVFNLAHPYVFDLDAIDAGTAQVPEVTSIELNYELDVVFDSVWDQDNYTTVVFDDPIAFSGAFHALTYINMAIVDGHVEFYGLMPGYMSLDGEFSNTSGDSMDLNVAFNIDNPEEFVSIDDVEFQTADHWLDGDVGITFKADLENIPDATITLMGERSNFTDGDFDMVIAFGNRQLSVSTTGNFTTGDVTSEVRVTNQDGAVLVLNPLKENEPSSLSYNGVVYGTIAEIDGGLIKLTYNDGTFEIF